MVHSEKFEKLIALFQNDCFAVEATGVVIDELQDKYAVCSFTVKKKHLNAANSVMGGAIYTLADYTFSLAANTESTTITLSSHINYLIFAKCERLIATARCIKSGKTVCVYGVEVKDEYGVLIAHATFEGYRIKTEKTE